MAQIILSIDQGTTGTTCLLIDFDKVPVSVLGRGYSEFPQHYPQPGWVEHDLNEIWRSVLVSVESALSEAGIAARDIGAISITNQRETVGFWDSSGNPLTRAIVWQDRRTAPDCERLRRSESASEILEKTGLVLDPYFSGTKIRWLLDNENLRSAKNIRCGTIDAWLAYKLSGGRAHVTDVTNASRTMLFDIHQMRWDDTLCEALGDIPKAILPEVVDSDQVYGESVDTGVLPRGIKLVGILGDQHAALLGQGATGVGMAKCTYGTGAFALMNTGEVSKPSGEGLLSTLAWKLKGTHAYALEGSVFVAGAMVQWLRDELKLISSSSEIESVAREVGDSAGVTVVPALTGLGAPHWDPHARGLISGLTRGASRAHICRAVLEGIAFQVNDLFDAMQKDASESIKVMRVDGGACANNLLMQFQADLMKVPLERPTMLETTALGAAFAGALGVGILEDVNQVAGMTEREGIFVPAMGDDDRGVHLERWRDAVRRALS